MLRNEEIAARAYEIWKSRGGTHGRAHEDWAQAERELQRFDVVLADAGKNKIGVIKKLREITGLDLEKVRDLVERAPQRVKEAATHDEVEAIRRQLTAIGARVEVR